jgi:SAM-dependent methyltransferase
MTELASTYQKPWIGLGYDVLVRLTFAPVGGLDALREEALAIAPIVRGARVLELGCGTGGFTRKLVERGAVVTAVDWSAPMLARARARAGSATFERSEITAYRSTQSFDLVFFGFVLHELDPEARCRALAIARDALAADGAVLIVDHALPDASAGAVPRAISRFVHGFEPGSIVSWLGGGMEDELRAVGLGPHERRPLARGTALALLARR